MSSVKPYEPQDFSTKKSTNATVRDLRPQSFQVQPEAVVKELGEKKTHHFQLDMNIASQLGLEEKAKKDAEEKIQKEINRRWETASEKAEVEGYKRGLEEGKTEAYKAELPRIKDRLDHLDHLLQELDKFRERIFVSNESFLMDLIAQVVKMIVLKEVEIDRSYTERLVMGLLHQLGSKDDTKIYLSLTDAENINLLSAAIEKEFGKLTNTVIEVRNEIPVGGCKIETRSGVVDASLETQIQNVMKALKA